ncbi:hypothetical protein [Lentilactobacillus sp. Marseille-Q4993]|uniref:hypothetical protein n=1 Tax=Lentilactobacillus sp. Marseille-Q4993 TaxID=3039492 RepID=UPI0024BC1D3F|nr:hypothetical protein [Lentilactobacillus sp. Marseille-Q4993]
MKFVFGSIITMKKQTWVVVGETVVNNPQLVLDNVNYIAKKNFVIHIKYGQGISRHSVLLCRYDGSIEKYLTEDSPKMFETAVTNQELVLVEQEEIDESDAKLVEELEIEADEKIAWLASVRQNALLSIEDYVKDLQKKIDKLSQRKKNHYFSSKGHYEDVKDYLLVISPFSDLRMKENQVRQDEWRLKLQLGGQ